MEGLEWILELKDQLTAPIKKIKKELGGLSDDLKQNSGGIDELGESINGLKAKLERYKKGRDEAFRTDHVRKYNHLIEETEKKLKDLEGLPKNTEQNWAEMATGVNQSLELVDKLVGSLDFADEYRKLETEVKRFTGMHGDELDDAVKDVYRLQEVYGDDSIEITRAANAITKQLGGSFEDNLAMIEEGYRRGANLNGDMIDQLQEYSSQAKDTGLNLSNVLAIMASGADQGVFGDKAMDSIKEASLALREMDQAQIEALQGIGLGLNDLEGLTGFDAVRLISKQLEGKGTQEVQKVIADVFKGAGEDAGLQFIAGLAENPMDITLREATEEADEPLMSFLSNTKAFFADTFGGMVPYIGTLAQVAAGVGSLVPLIQSLRASQIKLNISMIANPIGAIVAGIAALIAVITAVIIKYEDWGAALSFVLGPIGILINMIMSFKRNWESIKEAFRDGGFLSGIKRIGQVILDALLYPIQQLLELVAEFTGWDWVESSRQAIEDLRKGMDLADPVSEEEKEGADSKEKESPGNMGARVLSYGSTPASTGGSISGGSSPSAGFANAEKKEINVRIESMISNLTISTTTIEESAQQLKEKIAKALTDGVRDFEVVA